ITKPSKSKTPHPKTSQRNALLESVLLSSVPMWRACSFCERRGLTCEASPLDSVRCASCIRNNQSSCDVQGVSVHQLRKIASQHAKLESEMEKAEAELAASMAKVNRLRLQKR
ncbi:hypothetical protein QBC35DRAFT_349364, partial [Podospora australis]